MITGLALRPLLHRGLPSPPRGHRLRDIRELHGCPTFPDLKEIDDANFEHLGEVEQHLDAAISRSALQLLYVPVRKPLGRHVLLGEPLAPSGSTKVAPRPPQEGREVHGQTMAAKRTRIEPIRLACFALTLLARKSSIEAEEGAEP